MAMQWFENETFWESFYPSMFHERRFAAAAGQIDQVLALSGARQGAVLDLYCGPGRHSAVLGAKGFAVTAVDRSPYLLSRSGRAAERAAKP
jgi:tRNA/tmRNA/rRNA uracil-C5-methylase (TrmA/RlmC/RlmD family)